MRFVAFWQWLYRDFPQGGVPTFPRSFPYQVYRLLCWSGCLPVLCRLMFAGVLVALCHVCQMFLLMPHVECLS